MGYLGDKSATEIVLEGLKRLEYRGYDSAGIAILDGSESLPKVHKCAGGIDRLIAKVAKHMPNGAIGIGHTRWATHGTPSEVNAHPHIDCSGRIAVVHNGIIENYRELKAYLESENHRFVSETDTEVIVHLIEQLYQDDFIAAVEQALRMLKGSFAVALISTHAPRTLIGARKDAPLVMGQASSDFFLASDIPALLPYTRDVMVLEDNQMVVISDKGVHIFDLHDGKSVNARYQRVSWSVEQAKKGGFKHFMEKEINECPKVIRDVLVGKVNENFEIAFEECPNIIEMLYKAKSVKFIASGTSYHASLVGKYLVEQVASVPAEAWIASEFRYNTPPLDSGTVAVFLSQSGETADTIACLRTAKSYGVGTVAVTNVVGSTLAREADAVLYLNAGPEISVASTKTFIGHLVVDIILALYLANRKGKLSGDQIRSSLRLIDRCIAAVGEVLQASEDIGRIAEKYSLAKTFLYLGRGLGLPIAMEGALKLKEISYIHAEAVAAGEIKHGPIALLDEFTPVVAVISDSRIIDKLHNNLQEVHSRHAPIIAFDSLGSQEIRRIARDYIQVPQVGDYWDIIPTSVALQIFAYRFARTLGRPIDKPRNLAKSVTVE